MFGIISWMGQVFCKLLVKDWRKRQIRKVTDKVFDKVKNQVQTDGLSFGDLYIAVLLVYNGINKYIPGPHFDPPSKVRVREVIKICDINLDGQIDRDEFFGFIRKMAPETFNVVRKKLIATLVVAPTVAVATKRATGGVLGVGKLVQRLSKPVYASLMTIAALWFQDNGKEWRKRQIRKITDQVFDKVKNQEQTDNLCFQDLYIAVLLVYNGINKFIPRPHFDPPSKVRVREVIKICDINSDGQIDSNEFFDFIQHMATETFNIFRKKLITTLVVAPTVAVVTKRATEGVLGVGKLVQRLPKPVYAFLMTITALWFQENGQDSAL